MKTFFQRVVEERHRVEAREDLSEGERAWRAKGLKVLANATSYGIYAQMTRRELVGGRREQLQVYGREDNPFEGSSAAPEDPGDFAFPPVAASITGGARLMLATLERLVADAGGTYAFCDTDSMAIVASQDGGPVPCLGGSESTKAGDEAVLALFWPEVDAIRARFEALKPYDAEAVTDDLLELEDENFSDPNGRKGRRELWCYGISAKRYVLYHWRDGEPVLSAWSSLDESIDNGDRLEPLEELLKPSQHGLGHLLNPVDPEDEDRGWIAQAWRYLLRSDLGLPVDEPAWLDRPAVAQVTISSAALLRLFRSMNEGKPYSEQVKAFNFMNLAFVPPEERPADDARGTV